MAVFPKQVSIYETFNPGSVVRIWAASTNQWAAGDTAPNHSWRLLYEGEPECAEKRARIFAPELRNIPFATRLLRIELDHSLLDYHCQLDAVKLSGQIPPSGVMATLQLTHLMNIRPANAMESNADNLPSGEQQAGLLRLPQEVLLRVLAALDLPALARCARSCRRLRALASDWLLYAQLDLSDQWWAADAALHALSPRCTRLRALRVTGATRLCALPALVEASGSRLVQLSLQGCAGVVQLPALAAHCPALRELVLRGCAGLPAPGALAGLRRLTRLDLYASAVSQRHLVDALVDNPALQHLSVGSCEKVTSMDEVATVLANHNTALLSLDAWKTRGWSSVGLRCLGNLALLLELELGWSLSEGVDGLLRVVAGCPRLRKLGLAACRGTTDRDLDQLAHTASGLQQLDLMGVKAVSEATLSRLLSSCRDLRLLDLSFCGLPTGAVGRWRENHPQVDIKVAQGCRL